MGAGRARKLARLVKAPRMAKSSGSSRGKAAPVRVFPRPVFKLQPRNVVKVSARDLPEADPSAAKTAKWDGVVSSAEKNDTTEATAPIQPLADTQKLEAVHARSPQETPRNVRRSTVRMVPPSLNEKSTAEKSEKTVPPKKANLKSVYVDARKRELAKVLPALHPSGFTIRQATLLKMLGIVVLCGMYHYLGFYAGKKAARDELDAELSAANDKLQLTDTTLRKFWLERTLWKFNKDGEQVVHWMWGQHSGAFEELPELPTREEYIQALDEGLQAGLMTHQEYCGQLNRVAWHDWKTKEEAWKAFMEKPYRNILPLYWYARKNSDVITYIIEKRLPLSGMDAAAAERFLSWYLPHMESFDQHILAQELLGVRFDPLALKRTSGTNAVARLYRQNQTLLPGRDFYIEIDSKSVVMQDDKELCPLQFYTSHFYVGRAEDLRGTLYLYANLDERLKPSESLSMNISGKLVFIQKYARASQIHSIPFYFTTGNVAAQVFEEELEAQEKEARQRRKSETLRNALETLNPNASPEEEDAPTENDGGSSSNAHTNRLSGALEDDYVPELPTRVDAERSPINETLRVFRDGRELEKR
jgi:hypothetical protein